MNTREVRVDTKKTADLEKSNINTEDLERKQQEEAKTKSDAFEFGPYWDNNNKMKEESVTYFNNKMWDKTKGNFNSGMTKDEAVKVYKDREKIMWQQISRGSEKTKEMLIEVFKELGHEYIPKKPANAPPANASPDKPKATQQEEKIDETDEIDEPLIPETEENEVDKLRKENEELKAKLSQRDEDEKKIKEMAEKLDERADIPPEVQNNEPEDKPVDDIAPPPESKLSLDEKQRKIADTFPNTKALQTGCYETVRNTDYSRVTFNPKSLRPEYNYTKGITSKINVIQRVNVGNLNKYILR